MITQAHILQARSWLDQTNPNKSWSQKYDFLQFSADHIWADYCTKYSNGRYTRAKNVVNGWL